MNPKKLYIFLLLTLISYSCNFNETLLPSQEGLSENQNEGQSTDYVIVEENATPDIETCPTQELKLSTDLSIYQPPILLEPAPRAPFRDPVFGTCIVRVTDRQKDIPNSYDDSLGLKNEYARVQSFNADGSLLIVRSLESFWYVYDARSLALLGELPVHVEPRWDATKPFLLYYTEETKLMSYDLRAGKITEIKDFADEFPGINLAAVWTRHEGSPSYDSRFWGLLANDSEWNPHAFLIYDMQTDDVTLREIPEGHSIDNVTISPLGSYLLASFDNYCEPGHLGTDSNPCGFMVYDHNLKNGRGLLRIIGHYDALLDEDGHEVIIYQDIDTDYISMLDLKSGNITPLLEIDFSYSEIGFHFSGRASKLPQWALVSTYNGGPVVNHTWMDNSIFAVELKKGGRVVRLAHTHSVYGENVEHYYWAEPHASVNQDFTRIVFTSNWGRTGTEEVDMYMILLPENWIENLP